MQIQEKKLIKDLFKKLKLAENKSSFKDIEAESCIKKCLKKQPNAIYYMIQTILVQEVAIKKLNDIIKNLKNQSKTSSSNTSSEKSFLSELINKYIPNKSNESKKFDTNSRTENFYHNKYDRSSSPFHENMNTSASGNSFLTNALQTAVGVTGGIVAGNMLLNLFDHNKPEEDILNHSERNFISENEDNNQYDSINNENTFEDFQDHDFIPENMKNTSEDNYENENFINSDVSNVNNTNIHDLNDTSENISDVNNLNKDDISEFEDRNISDQEYFENEDVLDEDYNDD